MAAKTVRQCLRYILHSLEEASPAQRQLFLQDKIPGVTMDEADTLIDAFLYSMQCPGSQEEKLQRFQTYYTPIYNAITANHTTGKGE